jgi:hypothetical protein
MAEALTGVTYADLAIPRKLYALQRTRENHLRKFYVDGEVVQIRRDAIEPAGTYAYRASFVRARTFHPRQRLEELVVNSRVAANKRWSPAIRDDEGRTVQTPHYVDSVEERLARISSLASMDVRLDVVEEGGEDVFYEPEASPVAATGAVGKVSEPGEELVPPTSGTAGEEEGTGNGGTGKGGEEEEASVEGEYTTDRLGDGYLLVARYPLYQAVDGQRKELLSSADRVGVTSAQILQPWYTLYSSRMVGRLGNVTTPKFAVDGTRIALRVAFATEKAVEDGKSLLEEVIPTLLPLQTTINGKRGSIRYH